MGRAFRMMELAIGDIFRITLFPEDGVHPKNPGDRSRTKYVVVLGIDDESIMVGSVLINSKINDSLFVRIGPYQHCIYSSDYSFMTKDESYIDCFRIKEISASRLCSAGIYVGKLCERDIKAASELAASSPANKPAILQKYHLL